MKRPSEIEISSKKACGCELNESRVANLCCKCLREFVLTRSEKQKSTSGKARQEILNELLELQSILISRSNRFELFQEFITTLFEAVVGKERQNNISNLIFMLNEDQQNDFTAPNSYEKKVLTTNISIDSDTGMAESDNSNTIAVGFYKDIVEGLVDIFESNNRVFDRNFSAQLKSVRLFSSNCDSPFKEAQKFDKNIINQLKRASESRRQSLEMFEADKKILILLNENDRLTFSLNAKDEEIESVKLRLQKLEEEITSKSTLNPSDESPQLRLIKCELERVQKAVEFKNKEIQQLYEKNSTKIFESSEVVLEMQAQIEILVQENERLNAVILAKDKELTCLQSVTEAEDGTEDGMKNELLLRIRVGNEQSSQIQQLKKENQEIIAIKNQEISKLADALAENQDRLEREIQQQLDGSVERSSNNQGLMKTDNPIKQTNEESSFRSKDYDLWKSKSLKEFKGENIQLESNSARILYTQNPNHNNISNENYLISSIHSQNSNSQQIHFYNSTLQNSNQFKVDFGKFTVSSTSSVSSNTQSKQNNEAFGKKPTLLTQMTSNEQTKLPINYSKMKQTIEKLDSKNRLEVTSSKIAFTSRFKSPNSAKNLNQQLSPSLNMLEIASPSTQGLRSSIGNPISQSFGVNNYLFDINNLGNQLNKDRSGSSRSIEKGSLSNSNNTSFQLSQQKPYKQVSSFQKLQNTSNSALNQLMTPQSNNQFKNRLDSQILTLSKEIAKINFVGEQNDKKQLASPIQNQAQGFLKQTSFRSGSEGLKAQSNKFSKFQ